MEDEAQFQREYRKALRLALPSDSAFPRRLVEDLALADAHRLGTMLCELHVGPGRPVDNNLSLVQRSALQCARVVDLATDEALFGPVDWRALAERIHGLAQKGVPTAPLTLTALAAYVFNAWREYLYDCDDDPGGTYIERVADDEEEYAQLVRNLADSVRALWDKMEEVVGVSEESVRSGSGPFPAVFVHRCWHQHRTELFKIVADLERTFERNREQFGSKSLAEWLRKRREPFTPGTGNREGHYPAGIYCAFETALELVRTHWRTYGAATETQALFHAVGIQLTPSGIYLARRRRRQQREIG